MSTRGRRITNWVHAVSAVMALWSAAQSARAGVIYSYVTDASRYEAPPATPYGTTVPVNVYLQETLTDGSTSFIAANGGLAGGRGSQRSERERRNPVADTRGHRVGVRVHNERGAADLHRPAHERE
jgi:hypothetical protein